MILSTKQIIEQGNKTRFERLIQSDPVLRNVKTVAELVVSGIVAEKMAELEKFTQQKLNEITNDFTSFKTTIKNGEPGMPGENYILSDADKLEISEKIVVPIVEKVIEKTIVEKTEVIREIPQVHETIHNITKEVAVPEKPLEIVAKINTLEEQIEPRAIKGFWKMIDTLRQEIKRISKLKSDPYLHGGGSSGGSFLAETVSGTINGSNVTFTFPTAFTGSSFISLNGQTMVGGVDYTVSGTTITYIMAPGADLAGLTHVIFHT